MGIGKSWSQSLKLLTITTTVLLRSKNSNNISLTNVAVIHPMQKLCFSILTCTIVVKSPTASFWLPLWRIRVGFRRMLYAQLLKNSTLMGVVKSPRTMFGRFLEIFLMVTACKNYYAVLNLIMMIQSRLRNSKRICTSQIRTRMLIFSVFQHVAGHGRIANVYCICSTLCVCRCCKPPASPKGIRNVFLCCSVVNTTFLELFFL